MKKLPIGIKDFKNIMEDSYLYLDKTEYLYNLISEGKYYFISRPRRFGKSLLVSTLENIFCGNKELFRDLFIYDKWSFPKHPIIKIDFNEIKKNTHEILEKSLIERLKEIYEEYNLNYEAENYKSGLSKLIKKVGSKKKSCYTYRRIR